MANEIRELRDELVHFSNEITDGFASVNERLDGIDKQLDSIDKRLDNFDKNHLKTHEKDRKRISDLEEAVGI